MTDAEKLSVLNDWLADNQPRIDRVRRAALNRIPELADALRDPTLRDEAARLDRAHMIGVNSRAVLADYMAEEMAKEFSNEHPRLRSALERQANSITQEHLDLFIEAIIRDAIV